MYRNYTEKQIESLQEKWNTSSASDIENLSAILGALLTIVGDLNAEIERLKNNGNE